MATSFIRLGVLLVILALLPGLSAHTVASDSQQATGLDVVLTVHNTLSAQRTNEPVTSGVPIPQDLNLTDVRNLRLIDPNGQPVAAQFTPLARWGGAPDDATRPIRWLLVDFQMSVAPDIAVAYRLVDDGGIEPAFPVLELTEQDEVWVVDTGAAQFHISKANGRLYTEPDKVVLAGQVTDEQGDLGQMNGPVTLTVAVQGPMRLSVHVRGPYRDAKDETVLDYTSRYWFYAGQPYVRLFHTIENNTLCPLVESAQLDCFNIGSGGSIEFEDASFVLDTGLSANTIYRFSNGQQAISGDLTEPLRIYQDSSGTDHWDHYSTLVDWDGNPLDTRPRMQSYVSFRGYQTRLGEDVIDSGNHAIGWLTLSDQEREWAIGVRDFWQNFPKALRATPEGTLEIGLFPAEFGPADYDFSLRAGEHKTHEIWLARSDAVATLLTPLFAEATPAWYVDSGAFGPTALLDLAAWPDYEKNVTYQLDTAPTYEGWMDWPPNLPTSIEQADFHGIFDYGDWPIDYEGFGIAPLNIKYDADDGMWLQWLRGGDERWFSLAEAMDRHAADIDILHNLHDPRHWGDGIAFGHSYHDEDAFWNPHRNEGGAHPDTAYGMQGMLLTTYLTGYEKTYESAIELADAIEFRLHNDHQLCDFFSPGTCSGEGYGLGDVGLYDSGSRPAANALNIAVEAYRATGDERYLAVADAVVNWAQPDDQPYINGPTGDDLYMKPWLLNMYLRALANYLEMRTEFQLPDVYNAADIYLEFADWLHNYAWIGLDTGEIGARAAYPYEWWLDDRQGDTSDEWAVGNNIPSINNWLLLGADAMAYAYHLSGNTDYLEWAAQLFRTGSRDPWFEGDINTYTATKETANAVVYGHIFLQEWATH